MSEKVRVSCGGQIYAVADGRILGHYSRSKLKRSPPKKFVTLIGGRYNFDQETQALMDEFGFESESIEERRLAGLLPTSSLDQFIEWYFEGEGREVVPLREIREELIDEERVFPNRDQPYRLDQDFILTKYTERAGGGPQTSYFMDVFRLTMLLDQQGEAFRIAEQRDIERCKTESYGGIRLVTREESNSFLMNRPGTFDHQTEVGDLFQLMGLTPNELRVAVMKSNISNLEVHHLPDTYQRHQFE